MTAVVPTPKTLDEFIETLSAQRGLHRKVRLLGHYWRQVRDLPSEDRQRIALALGSESAWRHLEKFFGADGHLSEGELAVKRALRRVGNAEPEELRILAARLRSGDYTEVGTELLDAMSQALDAEVGAEAASGPEAAPVPTGKPARVSVPVAEPEPKPEKTPEPEPELESEPTLEPELGPESGSELEPESERTVEPAKVAPMPPLPPLPPAEVVELAAPEDRREHGIDRLPDPGGRAERRRRVVASGSGWRRRRVVAELIREGELEGLDEALDLAELLESDVQRAWCLGDLVQHWPLDEAQLDRVLEAAPSVPVRNRLLRRHERAAAHGRSLEEELRRVLAAAERPTRQETLIAATTIRELSAPVNDVDLAQLIREDRAR